MKVLRVKQDQSNRPASDLLVTAAQLSPQAAPLTGIVTRMRASSLIPYARYGARKLGHAGIIGLSILIFSAAAFVSTNSPLHDQVASQTLELDNLRAIASNEHGSVRASYPLDSAREIVAQLPSRNDLPQIMGQIVAVATAAGLSLDRGSYAFTSTESGDISSYRLKLPVRGSYPQVREFIENTLAAVPAAALESMRVERNEVSSQVIAADLEFAVLVGSIK